MVGAGASGFRSRSGWLERFVVQIGDHFILFLCGGGSSVGGGGDGFGWWWLWLLQSPSIVGGGGCVIAAGYLGGGWWFFVVCYVFPFLCLFSLSVRCLCVRVAESPVVFVWGSSNFSVGGRFVFMGLRRWFFVICFCYVAVFCWEVVVGWWCSLVMSICACFCWMHVLDSIRLLHDVA